MTLTYLQLTGYNKSILNVDIDLDNLESGFVLRGGFGNTGVGSTGLYFTGFSFTGSNGFLYDQSGRFFGGYGTPDKQVNLQIYLKTGAAMSYGYKGRLMANDLTADSIDFLEFEKHGDASLYVSHTGEKGNLFVNDILRDVTGIPLISSDNIMLRSS